jgi:hypothetical protein
MAIKNPLPRLTTAGHQVYHEIQRCLMATSWGYYGKRTCCWLVLSTGKRKYDGDHSPVKMIIYLNMIDESVFLS